MAQIRIKDTGKYSTGSSVVSGEKRAHGDSGVGTELTLKNAQLSTDLSCMTNDNPVVGKKYNDSSTEAFEYGEADSNGINLPKWTLSLLFNGRDEDDMITFGRLLYMCQTKGYKEVYTSTGNGFYDLIAYSKYGKREADGESTKTVDKINTRIKGITVNQTADRRYFKCTLNLVETA